MKELAVRLLRGQDLKESIEDICKDFDTCVVLSSVGCLSELKLRMAGGVDYMEDINEYEILSLNGTVSKGKVHLHLCASNSDGECVGGHLEYGCIINTTCELVIGILQDYESERVFDDDTGYKEIVFREKK